MSKRRERKPNLPQDTLNRARQQLAGDLVGNEQTETPEKPLEAAIEEVQQPVLIVPNTTSASPSKRVESSRDRARRRSTSVNASGNITRKDRTSDPAYIAEMLANPTKMVSEEELRQEYNYVTADLRSMALLAAGLFIALIVVAQVLPTFS
jgi:hypothetical protein